MHLTQEMPLSLALVGLWPLDSHPGHHCLFLGPSSFPGSPLPSPAPGLAEALPYLLCPKDTLSCRAGTHLEGLPAPTLQGKQEAQEVQDPPKVTQFAGVESGPTQVVCSQAHGFSPAGQEGPIPGTGRGEAWQWEGPFFFPSLGNPELQAPKG